MASKVSRNINTSFAFLLALIGVLFFSKIHLLYFAPFLVLSFYHCTRFAVLWRAIGCGVIVDLFSSNPHFGLTALNYTLVCWVLYGQTRNFFQDKLSTLPLMTLFFSILSTVTTAILFFFFSQPIIPSLKWVFTDLICMPFFDALYAFALSFPFYITLKIRKIIRTIRRAQ